MHEQQQLIEDAIAGSHSAFGELMRAHIPAVFRFINRMLHDETVAEDITQETFIKAWKSLRSFDTSKKFSTWVFQIAKNTAIDFTRKKKLVLLSHLDTDDNSENVAESIPDAAPLPDEEFDKVELAARVRAEVHKLGPRYSTVVLLHMDEQLTFAEIAEVLGEPLDTVKSRYRRALLRLRAQIAPK